MNTCILLLGSVVVIVFCRTALPVECLSLFRVLTYSGNDRGCLEQPTTCKSLARVFQKGLSSPFYSFLLVPVCCCWSQFDCSWQWIQNYVTIFLFCLLAFYLLSLLCHHHHHHHIWFWYLWCCSCPGLRGRQHLATPHTRSP